MLEALRKTIYAGIGASVVTAEKIEASLSELVAKGKLSADEAKEMAQKIADEGKEEFEASRESMTQAFKEFLEKSPVVTQTKFGELEKRVASLEAELKKLKKG